jgi:Zinc dependent phospholipase C
VPGAYAHITLVNEVREPQRLERIPGFPRKSIPAILKYFKFCELGAVSPDYPYLAIGDVGAQRWADTMHYTRTGDVIHAGIKRLQGMGKKTREKGLAWLLGFTAHVTTDVTIHPVVEMKVGQYKGNEKKHRICEMHQDAYIFQRLNLGGVGISEHLDSGIASCRDIADPDLLDRNIVSLWIGMLQDVVAMGLGLTYSGETDIDPQFIKGLATPLGKQDYDAIFDAAIGNVGNVWQVAASGATLGQKAYLARIGNWNLDTGRDENERLVFLGVA